MEPRIDTDALMARVTGVQSITKAAILDRVERREQEYRQMARAVERARSEAAVKEQQAELARRTRR